MSSPMGRNDSWPANPRRFKVCLEMSGVCEGRSSGAGSARGEGLCEVEGISAGGEGVWPGASTKGFSMQTSVLAGYRVCDEGLLSRGICPGVPSYLLSCKISAKLDNPRPSYSDLTNLRWPPSAILDVRRKHSTRRESGNSIFYLHKK